MKDLGCLRGESDFIVSLFGGHQSSCKIFLSAESQQLFPFISCWLRAESVALPFLGSLMVVSSSGSCFWKEVLAWGAPAWAMLLVHAHWVEHNSLPKRIFLAFLRAVSQRMVPGHAISSKTVEKLKVL